MKPVRQHQSQLRQKIARQMEHLQWLVQEIQGGGPFLRASFIERRRRCGKPRCRCARGRLHPESFMSLRANGQSRQISLRGQDPEQIKQWIRSYRRFRQNRSEMIQTFSELLRAMDSLAICREMGPSRLQETGALGH